MPNNEATNTKAANTKAVNIKAPIRGIDRVLDPKARVAKQSPPPDSNREKFVYTSCCSPWPNTTPAFPSNNMTGSDSTIWRKDQAWESLTWFQTMAEREHRVKAGFARGSFAGLADITFPACHIPHFMRNWKPQDAPWEIVPPGFFRNPRSGRWQFGQAIHNACIAERERRANGDAKVARREQADGADEQRRTEEARVRNAKATERVQRQEAENLAGPQAVERLEVSSQGHTNDGNGIIFGDGSQVYIKTIVNNYDYRIVQPPHDQQMLQMTQTQEKAQNQQKSQTHQIPQMPRLQEAPPIQQMPRSHSLSTMAPLHPGATNLTNWYNGAQLHSTEMNGTLLASTVSTPQQVSALDPDCEKCASNHSTSWSSGGDLAAPNAVAVNMSQALTETPGRATKTIHDASMGSSSNPVDLANDFTPPNNIETQTIQDQLRTWIRGHGFDKTMAGASGHSVDQNSAAIKPPASVMQVSQADQPQAFIQPDVELDDADLLAPIVEFNRQFDIEAARLKAEQWPRYI